MAERIAFLIGNQTFQPDSGFLPLQGPANDVTAIARLLRDPERGHFNVYEFLNRTHHEILPDLDQALGSAALGDLFLIYYSGHGKLARNGELCLATANSRQNALRTTSIPARYLRDLVEESDCDQVVLLLDCCYSGAVEDGLRGDIGSELHLVDNAHGFYIMTASTGMQAARETGLVANGMVMGRFTSALVNGIESGAADQGRKGKILLSDLRHYLERVAIGSTPLFFDRKASGDPLISLSPATAGPLLDLGVLADLDAEQWHRRLGAVSALSDVLRDGDAATRAAAKESLQRRLGQERDIGVRAALELALSRESVSAVGVPHPSMPSTEASSPPIAEALAPATGSVVRQKTVQEHKSEAAKTESNIAEREARALLSKGASFAPDRSEEAIAAYDTLIARFGNASELTLREQVAKALLSKGACFAPDRNEEEIAVYDDLIARFGSATETSLREQVAQALVCKEITLHWAMPDRREEAIAACDDLIARFGSATETSLREQVAQALVDKGFMLGSMLDRSEEAIAVYDDLIARFGSATETSLRIQVAQALNGKGNTLGTMKEVTAAGPWPTTPRNRIEEAIAVCDDLIARFGSDTEKSLREQVAQALNSKAHNLGRLGRSAEAIAVCDDLLARFGSDTETSLREQVAKALVSKGEMLGQLDRNEEEIAVYDDLIARFGSATETSLLGQVAQALVNKGNILGNLGRSAEAIAVFDNLIARFSAATEWPLDDRVAQALLNKGQILGDLGRRAEAIAVYDDLIARFGAATKSYVSRVVNAAKSLRDTIHKS